MPVRIAKMTLLAGWFIVLTAGCATRNHFVTPALFQDDGSHRSAFIQAEQTINHLFPERYRAIQRAIVTTGGKQFTCDGLLTVSPVEGHHLALVSSFGVVTDLRVRADGSCELLKVTPIFNEDWSRRFVARDLHRMFVVPADLQPAGRLADGGVVLQSAPDSAGVTARYIFSTDGERWRELDLMQNNNIFYRAIPKNFRKFAGATNEIPGEFEVSAEAYRLELRLAELTVPKETQP